MGGAARSPLRQPRTDTERRHFEFLKAESEIAHETLELGLSESATGASGLAELCFRRAKRAHATVIRFLAEPKYALTNEDRACIQAKVAELEQRVEALRPKQSESG